MTYVKPIRIGLQCRYNILNWLTRPFLAFQSVHYLVPLPNNVVTSHTDKILPPCHPSRHNQILFLINNQQLKGYFCLYSLKVVYFVEDLIQLHVPVFRCQTVSTFGWRMCNEPALSYQPRPHTDQSCPLLHTVTNVCTFFIKASCPTGIKIQVSNKYRSCTVHILVHAWLNVN